jgi:hypothetical protein
MKALRGHGWIALAALLGVAALWQPTALYLFALAVFGLPHVLWEMAWVRRVWGAALPRAAWICLLAALLLQACARLALWRGRIDAATAAACDAATLALALLATLLLLRRVRAGHRVLLAGFAVLLPLALFAVADTPQVLGVLALLAIAHNFTPIGLMPAGARIGAWQARRVMLVLFAAPVLLFALLWALQTPGLEVASLRPAELGWVQGYSPRLAAALLPALVWAQSLHYLAVLHLMPRAIGSAWQGMPLRALALVACGLLLAYFIQDYRAARGLYAVAAGMHAWLEWPLILLALLGFSTHRAAPDMSPAAAS